MQERQLAHEEYDYYQRRPQDLKRLLQLEDWAIAEGEPDIRGWTVVDENGDKQGKIDDVLVDTETGEAIFALVEHGGMLGVGGKRVLVPLDQFRMHRREERMILKPSPEHLKDAPEYKEDVSDFGPFYDFWGGGERRGVTAGEFRQRQEQEDIEEVKKRAKKRLESKRHERQTHEAPSFEERVRSDIEERLGESGQAEQAGEQGVSERTRMRVERRKVEGLQEAEPGEIVIHKGETVEIPVVEEKPVVTERIVIHPEEEEEIEEEEVRHQQ